MNSTTKHTFIAVAILVSQQKTFAVDLPSQEPVVIEASAASTAPFTTMVAKDIEAIHKKQSQEIERMTQKHEAQTTASQSAMQADVNRHESNARAILASIIANNDSPFTNAEANLKLAILESSTNAKQAQKYIREAVNALGTRDAENPILASKVHLFAGELALQQQDYKRAHKEFSRAAQIANNDHLETREFLLRAQIGKGDAAFEEYRFEDADAAYLPALKIVQTADPILRSAFEVYRAPLMIRRLWATFRGGHYSQAAEVARDLAKQQPTIQQNFDENVLSDVINSAGIALSDKNDKALLQDITSDKRAGEFGKDIAIACIRHLLRTGRVKDAESTALAIDESFIHSSRLVDFMQERWNIATRLADSMKIYSVGTLLVERLSYDSTWRKETPSDSTRENQRSKMVAQISLDVGDKLLQMGKKSDNSAFLKKSYILLQAHLLEPMITSERAIIYLKSGEAALLSHNYNAAWTNTKASFTYDLTIDQKKNSYNQLVSIALEEANSAEVKDTAQIAKYIDTVDSFARAFPEDYSARLALFESARKLETIGKSSEARERFERLLAQSPEWTTFETHEREDVVLALLALNARDVDTKRSTNALNNLERQFDHEALPSKVKSKIQASNAAAIRAHASTLRADGKLEQALKEQMAWAQENAHNSETPFLLTDIAKGYFELGNLRQCSDASSVFLANYQNHSQKHQALYWKARALESELAFVPAANAFVAASWDEKSSLTPEERTDALTRAQQIFLQLNNTAWSARAREKLATVNAALGEKSYATLLLAAEDWLSAKQYVEADKLFARLIRDKATPQVIRLQSQLGLIETHIKNGDTQTKSRLALSGLMNSFAQSKNPAATGLLNRATLVALEADLDRLAGSETTETTLSRFSQTEAAATKMLQRFQSKLSPPNQQRASILVAAIQSKLSERYSLAAESQALGNSIRSDRFLQQAEKYKMSARSTLFSAVRIDNSNRAETANALALLGSKIHSGSEPALELIEPEVDNAIEAVKGVFVAKSDKDQIP